MLTNLKEKLLSLKEAMGGRQFIALLLFLLILFTVPITVYLVKQRQELRSRATSERTLSLEFASVPQSVTKGSIVVMDVVVSSAGVPSSLSAVDFTVSYDKNILTFTSFTPTVSPLGEVIWATSNPAGSYRFIAVSSNAPDAKSNFKVGTITFQVAPSATNTTVSFAADSELTVLEDAEPYIGQRLTLSQANLNMSDRVVPPGPTDTPTPTPAPQRKVGDANDDACVNVADYNIWKTEAQGRAKCADWRGGGAGGASSDGTVDASDFAIWYSEWQKPANRENCIEPVPNTCLNN